jgi:tetratricopeptide (TPR) repeat protein
MKESDGNIDIDTYWEYSDPTASEARFRAALDKTEGDLRLEILTQIGRTFSLRGRFEEAHEILNDVEKQLGNARPRPLVRYLLERGRTFNSNGKKEKARDLFIQAWEQANDAQLDDLAVDAAHMIAITFAGSPDAVEWNKRGLALARSSQDLKTKGLIPAMLNNSAWDLHAMGQFEESLMLFEEAQAEWTSRGKRERIQIAKWSVARCLRSLKRYDEALAIQRALELEHKNAGTINGYVFEEIAENMALLGRNEEAKTYFEMAYVELGKDEWFVKNESKRLENLRIRGRK